MSIEIQSLDGFSNEEIESLFNKTYQMDSKYRLIDPKMVYSGWGSIRTVLDGTRPLGDFLDGRLAKILGKINGVQVIEISGTLTKPCYCVFRCGEELAAQKLGILARKMLERVKIEGYENLKAFRRILDSCEEYGNLFFYAPEYIAQFKEKIQRLEKEEQFKIMSNPGS